jgi:ribosomal protein L11
MGKETVEIRSKREGASCTATGTAIGHSESKSQVEQTSKQDQSFTGMQVPVKGSVIQHKEFTISIGLSDITAGIKESVSEGDQEARTQSFVARFTMVADNQDR